MLQTKGITPASRWEIGAGMAAMTLAGMSLTLPAPIHVPKASTSLGAGAAVWKSLQPGGEPVGIVGQLTPPTFTGVKPAAPMARELSIAHSGLPDGTLVAPRRLPSTALPKTPAGSARPKPPSPPALP